MSKASNLVTRGTLIKLNLTLSWNYSSTPSDLNDEHNTLNLEAWKKDLKLNLPRLEKYTYTQFQRRGRRRSPRFLSSSDTHKKIKIFPLVSLLILVYWINMRTLATMRRRGKSSSVWGCKDGQLLLFLWIYHCNQTEHGRKKQFEFAYVNSAQLSSICQ